MKKEKVYILQKETLRSGLSQQTFIVPIGTEFEFNGTYYVSQQGWAFGREFVENNPEWFKEKEEPKATIIHIRTLYGDVLYDISDGDILTCNHVITKERLAEILIEEQLKANK